MKKALIPIAVLLAFSMLITSVSAPNGYFAVRFHGYASGCCWVFTEEPGPDTPEPTASGRGRFHIRGFAIAREDTGYYWASRAHDPNTHIWIRRTHMRVRWDNQMLMVHMWPSDYVYGMFVDAMDTFYLLNMSFAGYYIGDLGLQYIRGNNATIYHGLIGPPGEEILASVVMLYDGADHLFTFAWVGEEIPELPPGCTARRITHRVTVWPIRWLPIIR